MSRNREICAACDHPREAEEVNCKICGNSSWLSKMPTTDTGALQSINFTIPSVSSLAESGATLPASSTPNPAREFIFQEIDVGKIYTGKVVSITAFGAFMEVIPGKDGLIHISELAEGLTENVEDVVKVGEFITAKCLGVDEKGRVKMSRRAWLRDQIADQFEHTGVPAEARQAAKSGGMSFATIAVPLVLGGILLWWLNRDSGEQSASAAPSSISGSNKTEVNQTSKPSNSVESLVYASKDSSPIAGGETNRNTEGQNFETFRKSPSGSKDVAIIESPSNAKLIIGKWLERKYVIFYPDGTWALQRHEEAPIDREGRQWTLSGNKVTRTWPGGSIIERIDSLDRSEMKLSDEVGNVTIYRWVSAIPETKLLSDGKTSDVLNSPVGGGGTVSNQPVPSGKGALVPAGAMPQERFPESRLRVLNSVDLEKMSGTDLRYAINEMFARHGAKFDDAEVQTMFATRPWYRLRPDVSFDRIEQEFSETEKSNLQRLAARRNELSRTPADAGGFTGRAVINDPDGYTNVRSGPSTTDPVVARIKDGEVFQTDPKQGAWWRVRTDKGTFGYVHQSRIRLLADQSDYPAGTSSTNPGERYPATRVRPLTESEILQLNSDALRYAINEIFARHGADFRSDGVKAQFSQFSWYQPRVGVSFDDIETREFTAVERANLKLLGQARLRLNPVQPKQ